MPPAPPLGRLCKAPGCEVRGRKWCDAHWAELVAQRYFGPEDPDAVFTCIVPGCATRVPHRDFICGPHWARVPKKRQWKIKRLSQLYRIWLGQAVRDAAGLDRQEPL